MGSVTAGKASSRISRPLVSPVLERIMHGGSALTLDIAATNKRAERPLFIAGGLNRIFIFKDPALAGARPRTGRAIDGRAPGQSSAQNARSGADDDNKLPRFSLGLNTGIYVPYHPREPGAGGQAVYLGHSSEADFLRGVVGVTFDASDEAKRAFERDREVLRCFDRIPSLDPFLVANELRKLDPNIDTSGLAITPLETAEVKKVILERLGPIINRAIIGLATLGGGEVQRFISAIWNPSMPEAASFIAAFGIERDLAPAIFEGLRGVSFYEHILIKVRPRLIALVNWQRSDSARPLDWRQNRSRQEAHRVMLERFQRQLQQQLQVSIDILRRYNDAFTSLLDRNDPKPFREILINAEEMYWQLGSLTASFRHVINLYEFLIERRLGAPMRYDDHEAYLKRLLAVVGT